MSTRWLPSIHDRRDEGRKVVGAIVYGETLEEMRKRKHAVVKLFNELESEVKNATHKDA